jgi:hypothetical protein
MQLYLAYMINKTLPEDVVKARRIARRSKAFVVVQGKLYKKSITGVLQICVTPRKVKSYCRIYMKEYMVITLVAEPYQPKLSVQDFTG